jgi:hypothetical protein
MVSTISKMAKELKRIVHISRMQVLNSSNIERMNYIYLGDRLTDDHLKGQRCEAVQREDGKCIRGRNGSMLVRFEDGTQHVVLGRRLRKRTSKH